MVMHEPECFKKIAVFKVKVTVKDHVIKIQILNMSSELLILMQLSFDGTPDKFQCPVKRLDLSFVVKVTEKFKMLVNVILMISPQLINL